jgi:hypothetical protein
LQSSFNSSFDGKNQSVLLLLEYDATSWIVFEVQVVSAVVVLAIPVPIPIPLTLREKLTLHQSSASSPAFQPLGAASR